MSESLYISPLAEVTTLGEDKIAISVVGRRFTVEDRVGILKSILADAAHGVTLKQLLDSRAESFPPEAVEAAVNALVEARVLLKQNGRSGGDATSTTCSTAASRTACQARPSARNTTTRTGYWRWPARVPAPTRWPLR